MVKVMFSMPESIVFRMKASIPNRERSKVLVRLLEKELKEREELLFQQASALESCVGLQEEMKQWDEAFGEDGLEHV